jgi:pimeloyl-ACP methyl ester carboxylesterase
VADVLIFHEAVRYALENNEFLKTEEIERAKEMLRLGQDRADNLLEGRVPWAVQSGLVVRGYFSRIDDSVQPYGLVVPSNWSPGSSHRWRLDTWFHGRSENLTELNFLQDRTTNAGQFTPPDTIVLHLYGRYCNANKFAGEVDLFEALDSVRSHYRIDPDRISVRGFSMGGAAVWHMAAHHAGLWAAAAPGAGFAESAEFLNVFKTETVKPTWWEQKLWRLYDATLYAANFANLPLVAYSGEKDRQMQAALVMARELAKEGMRMKHIIGPDTPHRYHPESKILIDDAMNAILARGRDPYPGRLQFVTYTLAYDRMKWVRVDGLRQHWEPGRIEAELRGPRGVRITTSGITAFTLDFGAGGCPLDQSGKVTVTIGGKPVAVPGPLSDRSWTASFVHAGGAWRPALDKDDDALQKRHGLQGPIDDAFMNRFIIVKPTGKPMLPTTAAWVDAEMNRAIKEWRRHFRGEAIVRNDSDVSAEDILTANLVLWGDPGSNRFLARIAAKLPLVWDVVKVGVGKRTFSAAGHMPVMIYPNPLNPRKYLVINSGFTFREYDYLNNARQVPKLPDFAIVNLATPPDGRWPGRIAHAGFFNEQWKPSEPPAAVALPAR